MLSATMPYAAHALSAVPSAHANAADLVSRWFVISGVTVVRWLPVDTRFDRAVEAARVRDRAGRVAMR
jgi:hypothetical protein